MCDCILRDSASYLDHINGKYHNRALGMSMRVERSTADDVRCPNPVLPLSVHEGGLMAATLGACTYSTLLRRPSLCSSECCSLASTPYHCTQITELVCMCAEPSADIVLCRCASGLMC